MCLHYESDPDLSTAVLLGDSHALHDLGNRAVPVAALACGDFELVLGEGGEGSDERGEGSEGADAHGVSRGSRASTLAQNGPWDEVLRGVAPPATTSETAGWWSS